MGVVPGMPNLVFLSIATLLAVIGYRRSAEPEKPQMFEANAVPEEQPDNVELSWDDVSSPRLHWSRGWLPINPAGRPIARRRPFESDKRCKEENVTGYGLFGGYGSHSRQPRFRPK